MDTLTRKMESLKNYIEEQKHFFTGEGDALFVEIEKCQCYKDFEDSYYNRYQTTPLILAIIGENITIVKKLLLAGADINFVDEFMYQPLLYALVIDSTAIVKLLLEYGANKEANFPDDGSQVSYFQRVCEASNKEIVKLFLDYGCNVNTQFCSDTCKYPNDCRPLHLSVINKRLEILKLLISYKADVNMTNEAGDTALHIACEINFTEAVIELLNANALLNIKSKNYLTPLYKCVKNKNFETMKLLLAHGLNLDSENSETLLNLYAQLEVAICYGYIKVLEDFLNYGLDVNRKFISQNNKKGKTLLHAAVEYDQEAVISLLLKFNASIIVKDDDGSLPLHIAAEMGKLSVIKQLLQQDLKLQALPKFSTLHAVDKTYWTSLHKACMSHVVECVEYLLECGAEVEAENKESDTPLHIACKNDCARIVKVLLEAGADPLKSNDSGQTALGQAIAVNSKECVEVLLQNSLDVNVKENRQLFWDLLRTPSDEKCELAGAFLRHGFVPEPSVSHASIKLFFAVTSQYIEPLTSLIQEGADVNATFGGQSFLHLATACRHYDGVKALIAAGADVFARNADGRLAIYYAFYPGGEQLVQLFLDSGLKPSEHPELYHYPIFAFTDLVNSIKDCEKLATTEQDYVNMLSQLENQGADVNYCDDEGQNAMHLLLCFLRTRHEKLIERGIEIEENYNIDTKNGIALFDHLLRRVNLNAKTRKGQGPLHLAVELYNMQNVLEALLSKRGLYLDSRDVLGNSALHVAFDYSADQTIDLLMDFGADLNRPNAAGHLILDSHIYFAEFQYRKMLILFRVAGLPLRAQNAKYLSQFESQEGFVEFCRDELKKLDRLCQLGTVRDLFAVPEHRLARLARHPDLLHLVQYHRTEISIDYQPLLYRRLEQAVWRAGVLAEATQAFDAIVCTFGCRLPGDCIEAVFEYLTDYELEGFCRAAHANAQETAKFYQQLTDNLLNVYKRDWPMDHLDSDDST